METPYIFNIQKFSLHDGPGIRTTIFFKGCPLKCLWCHNPESQGYQPEQKGRGTGVGAGTGIGGGAEGFTSKQYSVDELINIIQADQIFYDQSGGGATFSGGEPMAQDIDYMEKLAQGLNKTGISIVIDTGGHAPRESFTRLLPYASLFLYDLKLLDSEKHKKYTGAGNELILDNLLYISGQQAIIDLRIMIAEGVNTAVDMNIEIAEWLKDNAIALRQINLLPYHEFGREKYARLGRECTHNFIKPGDYSLGEVKKCFEGYGYTVKIGG